MTATQAAKADALARLHAGPGVFVIANAWDGGSARMLAALGFAAIATSSGAAAGALGRRDGAITRAEAMAHSRLVAGATELPVAADLENGFGDTVDDAATTIRKAAATGLVGGSIEDCSRTTIYPFELSVARIEAAVAAARAHPFRFALTARTENFLRGKPDLDDTIRRLKAFEAAGADVLMAPGLPDLEAVRKVCQSLTKPFSFMAGIKGKSFSVAELEAAGVRRVSLATSLYRAAMTGLVTAAREVKDTGTFGYLETTLATPEINAFLEA
jgi:2-methylisocitrate lyase-like PEP mutase family enzyme